MCFVKLLKQIVEQSKRIKFGKEKLLNKSNNL